MSRITENDVAIAIMRIAAQQPSGLCSFDRARAEVPSFVRLSLQDMADSTTRPGEPMWHQLIRNIQSHHESDGNFIRQGFLEHVPDIGYRITDSGRAYIANLSS